LRFFTLSAFALLLAAIVAVIPVSVFDKDGNFVDGLTAENFRGEFRGQPVAFQSVSSVKTECAVLMVDVSPGVRGYGRAWELTWMAVRDLLSSLDTSMSVRLITFAKTALNWGPVPLGQDESTAKLLEDARAQEEGLGDSTRFYAALMAAVRMAPVGCATVLYVVSDGIDTGIKPTATDVRVALIRAGLPSFFFVLPRHPGVGVRTAVVSRHELTAIAEATGGAVFDFRHSSPKAFSSKPDRADYRLLLQHYRVEIELLRTVDKRRKWRLEVVDKSGKRLEDVQLTYPRFLVPPTEPTND
jgi:hypothetical protein